MCCSWRATCSASWPGRMDCARPSSTGRQSSATSSPAGGTILTLTGNHDNENFCRTLTHAMNLAAPTTGGIGDLVPAGRLYLATEPTLLRLRDRHEAFDVQFILMPYPTPTRYLRDEASQKYASPEEKNQKLMTAFLEALRTIQRHERFDPGVLRRSCRPM